MTDLTRYHTIIDRVAEDCDSWGVFTVRLRDYLEALLADCEISPWDYESLEDYAWKYRNSFPNP